MAGFNTKNKNNHGEYEITFYTDDEDEYKYIQQCCRNVIDHAQPERKMGKWIEYDNSHCECPFCHEEWSYFDNEVEYFNFCPNCGADMRGDQ